MSGLRDSNFGRAWRTRGAARAHRRWYDNFINKKYIVEYVLTEIHSDEHSQQGYARCRKKFSRTWKMLWFMFLPMAKSKFKNLNSNNFLINWGSELIIIKYLNDIGKNALCNALQRFIVILNSQAPGSPGIVIGPVSRPPDSHSKRLPKKFIFGTLHVMV